MKNFKNWIDLSLSETTQVDSNFDDIAKTYIIKISSLLKDDLSKDTFFKALRMSEVLKDIMRGFFGDIRYNAGFQDGKIEQILVPSRVMAYGSKTIKTGIIYNINIH